MILLVEDDPNRIQWFRDQAQRNAFPITVTKDVGEAKRLLDENTYEQIFLDHDLSDEHYAVWREGSDKHDATTGYAVADYIALHPDKSPDAEIIIHSLNPIGSERMWRRIRETRQKCRRVTYLELISK